jgi:hypothetical protein
LVEWVHCSVVNRWLPMSGVVRCAYKGQCGGSVMQRALIFLGNGIVPLLFTQCPRCLSCCFPKNNFSAFALKQSACKHVKTCSTHLKGALSTPSRILIACGSLRAPCGLHHVQMT